VQVAEGAMDQVGTMLTRLKELATQAASSNVSQNDRAKINAESNTLISEINRIAQSTQYSGTNLIDGSFGIAVSTAGSTVTGVTGFVTAKGMAAGEQFTITATTAAGVHDITLTKVSTGDSQTLNDVADAGAGTQKELNFSAFGVTLVFDDTFADAVSATGRTLEGSAGSTANFQIGAKSNSNNYLNFSIASVEASSLNTNLAADMLSTQTKAYDALAYVDDAISTLNSTRSNLGAVQNRLTYASANLDTSVENLTAAESVIRDVDMAAEMTAFTKNQILMQAGTAMVAQANQAPQQILALFGR